MSRRQAQGEETPERRLWAQAIDWIVVLFRALKRWPGREALELSGHLRVVAVSAAAQITRAWLRPPARAGSPHLERARQTSEALAAFLAPDRPASRRGGERRARVLRPHPGARTRTPAVG